MGQEQASQTDQIIPHQLSGQDGGVLVVRPAGVDQQGQGQGDQQTQFLQVINANQGQGSGEHPPQYLRVINRVGGRIRKQKKGANGKVSWISIRQAREKVKFGKLLPGKFWQLKGKFCFTK